MSLPKDLLLIIVQQAHLKWVEDWKQMKSKVKAHRFRSYYALEERFFNYLQPEIFIQDKTIMNFILNVAKLHPYNGDLE